MIGVRNSDCLEFRIQLVEIRNSDGCREFGIQMVVMVGAWNLERIGILNTIPLKILLHKKTYFLITLAH